MNDLDLALLTIALRNASDPCPECADLGAQCLTCRQGERVLAALLNDVAAQRAADEETAP